MAFEFLEKYQLVPFGVALIAVILLFSSLWRQQRKRSRKEGRSVILDRSQGIALDTHLKEDMESLIVELQELSRRISAEIDTRFAKMEAVIRDADRRIAILNRLGRQLGEKTGETNEDVTDHNARHSVIYELADAGFTPIEIAKDLGKTPGEVELILNLRKRADS